MQNDLHSVRRAGATVRAYARDTAALRRRFLRRPQRARTLFQRLSVLHPAACGKRQQRRRRQNRTVALHPRGGSPTGFPPPVHALERLESRFYPDAERAPRRPRLRRREVGQYDPRLRLPLDPDDDYRPAKPSRRGSEHRSAPVGSMASARSLDFHSDKTYFIGGAKRARTSIRLGEGVERSASS